MLLTVRERGRDSSGVQQSLVEEQRKEYNEMRKTMRAIQPAVDNIG